MRARDLRFVFELHVPARIALRMNSFRLMAVAAILFIPSSTPAGEWLQWRGPNGNGVSAEKGLATEWDKSKNVAWRRALPGPAGSTPCIADSRIFLTTVEGDDLYVMAFSTGGEELWRQKATSGNKDARAGEGNTASPSPATDGKHVWAFFGNGILVCYDRDGKEVWKFDVQDRYGKIDIQFGMTSTPVLDGDDLYLQLIHGTMGNDYTVGKVIKLEKATGKEIWAVDRKANPKAECKHSYASALIFDDGKSRSLITHGADCVVGIDLKDGHELWRLDGLNGPSRFNQNYDGTLRFVASPGFSNEVVIVPSAKKGPVVAIKPPPQIQGDITKSTSDVLWTYERTPDVCCPLVVGDRVYLNMDARVACLEALTGKLIYESRIHSSVYRGSPIYADGHIYLIAKDGVVTVIKEGTDTMEVVAENNLGEPIAASPAVADGTIYIRTYDALYAIRNKAVATK
jgi:outer membrane protein assembly factor BamB